MASKNLVIERIALAARELWRFDPSNYPALNVSDEQSSKEFAIKHVTLHLTKLMGQVAAAIEPMDHGEGLDQNALRLRLSEMIITAIQCADLADISFDAIDGQISTCLASVLDSDEIIENSFVRTEPVKQYG